MTGVIFIMIFRHFEALTFSRNYRSILEFYIWVYSIKRVDLAITLNQIIRTNDISINPMQHCEK